MRTLLATFVLVAAACSGRTQADCDAIASDIRAEAQRFGLPHEGVCLHPAAPQSIRSRCDELRRCNEEVD
jgi:hypothetical protein